MHVSMNYPVGQYNVKLVNRSCLLKMLTRALTLFIIGKDMFMGFIYGLLFQKLMPINYVIHVKAKYSNSFVRIMYLLQTTIQQTLNIHNL